MTTTTMTAPVNKNKNELAFQDTKKLIESPRFQAAIEKALPRQVAAEFFIRATLTAVMRTPKLALCTQASMINCILQLAQTGLHPDGRLAHLIPRGNECTLSIDYKGLVEMVMRTGLVSSIHADVVCENDFFEYKNGEINHTPELRKPRGDAFAAFAIINFKDGTKKTEVMTAEDIYTVREKSDGWRAFCAKSARQSPWNPAEPAIEREMWKKTVFRRATKWVSLSPASRKTLDNEAFDAPSQVRAERVEDVDDHINALTSELLQNTEEDRQQPEPANNGEQPQEAEMVTTAQQAATDQQQPDDEVSQEPLIDQLLRCVAQAEKISDVNYIEVRAKDLSHEEAGLLVKSCSERRESIKARRGENSGNKSAAQ